MFDYHGVKYMCDLHFVYGPLHDNVYIYNNMIMFIYIKKFGTMK